MERIGERLKRRREELGFTVEDVAAATKFRPETIRAVEEGTTGVFPAEAYLNAFLRAYASKLGLDAGEVVKGQRSEEERIQEAIRGIRLRPRRRVNLRQTLIWLGIISAAVVAVLFLFDGILKDRHVPRSRVETHTDAISVGQAFPALETASADSGGRSLADTARDEATLRPTGPWGGLDRGEVPELDEPGYIVSRAAIGLPVAESVTHQPPAEVLEPVSCLEVAVSDWPIRARLRGGDSVLVEGWLRPGYSGKFYSSGPFVIDYLTDKDAISLKIDGEEVGLPESSDKRISGFTIPSGR